jgi:hypothetical protein
MLITQSLFRETSQCLSPVSMACWNKGFQNPPKSAASVHSVTSRYLCSTKIGRICPHTFYHYKEFIKLLILWRTELCIYVQDHKIYTTNEKWLCDTSYHDLMCSVQIQHKKFLLVFIIVDCKTRLKICGNVDDMIIFKRILEKIWY